MEINPVDNNFIDQATTAAGQVVVTFAHAFSVKPILSVTIQNAGIGGWEVSAWSVNGDGNYDGATLQFRNYAGAAVGVIAAAVCIYARRSTH